MRSKKESQMKKFLGKVLPISLSVVVAGSLLTGCGSESKAAPYLTQICADWQSSNYNSGSIETRDNLTSKFSSQISTAISLDPSAAAEFQVAINLMKNVSVLENQEAEYSARGFIDGLQYFKDLAATRGEEANAEKEKVIAKFNEICGEYE